jgi:hypothetical protein
MSSHEQTWAYKRNWSKYKLAGVYKIVSGLLGSTKHYSNIFTPEEIKDLRIAKIKLGGILNEWSDNNKKSKKVYIKENKNAEDSELTNAAVGAEEELGKVHASGDL